VFTAIAERSTALGLHHTGTLVRSGWAYMALLLAVNFWISTVISPDAAFTTGSYMTEPLQQAEDTTGLRILALIANVLIGFSIAIAFARRILIDARDFPLTIGRRTINVIYYQILLTLIGLISLIPLGLASLLLGALTAGLGLFMFLAAPFIALMVVQRFSVILPATAVDDRLSLGDSWRATSGMGWAMAFNGLLASFLLACLIGIWALLLKGVAALTPDTTLFGQFRSAAFPFGAIILTVWVFASLHATCYGLIREKYAARLGLTRDLTLKAEAKREAARALRAARSMRGS